MWKYNCKKSQKQGLRWISCLKEPTFSQKSQLIKLTQKIKKKPTINSHTTNHLPTLAFLHLYSFRYLRIWHALAVNTDQFLLLIFTNSIVSIFNCPSFSLDRISTNLAYPSSIRLLVSFCYSYSQTASFPLKCRSSLLPQISTNLASIALLAFWSVSVIHIHKENRFHSTVVQLYQFRSIRIRDIWAVLVVRSAVSITFVYKRHCLCSSVVHLYQFRYPGVRRSQAVLAFWSVSVSFFHRKHHLYSTIVHVYLFTYLGSQDTRAVRAFLSVSVAFSQGKILFPLNCRSSLSVHVSRKLGYWHCDRL